MAWGGASAPANGLWLLCDGSAVSRTTYAALFADIGTTFGSGNGSTTFNLPNMPFKIPRGNTTPGGTGGTLNHTHAGTSHLHNVTLPATHSDHNVEGAHNHNAHGTISLGTTVATTATLGATPVTHSTTGGHDHGGGTAHQHSTADEFTGDATPGASSSNNPPFVTTYYIIRI